MDLLTVPYLQQAETLPKQGRCILAQYDDDSIIVYQAYRSSIGNFAAKNGYFGGDFSLDRMSWIKPNFLWMMYRSIWGTAENQEVVLAVKIQRSAFSEILAEAVHSKFIPELYRSEKEWHRSVTNSSVRLQWDPDRHPSGTRLARKAIQLGLREDFLNKYARDWILEIENISDFVRDRYQFVKNKDWQNLSIPKELIYPVNDDRVSQRLQLSSNLD
jgi:Domain of unknown function (DUF4291)